MIDEDLTIIIEDVDDHVLIKKKLSPVPETRPQPAPTSREVTQQTSETPLLRREITKTTNLLKKKLKFNKLKDYDLLYLCLCSGSLGYYLISQCI